MSGNGTGRRGRAVVFDYGNVLYAWESHGALAGRRPARVWEEFVTRGGFPRWNEMADAGVPFGDILAALGRAHPDRPDWADLLSAYWRHFPDTLTEPIPGVGTIVDDLLDAGIRLYALTNFNHESPMCYPNYTIGAKQNKITNRFKLFIVFNNYHKDKV